MITPMRGLEKNIGCGSREIHIHRVFPTRFADSRHLWHCLSREEQARADRFRFETDRSRFIRSHAHLRYLLHLYLDTRREDIVFETGPFGRPEIASTNPNGIRFSMSVSEDLVVVAVCRKRPVGVDVEKRRHLSDADAIAGDFFRPDEAAWIQSQSSETKSDRFLDLWTRKEALLKAIGKGIPALRHAPSLLTHRMVRFEGREWSVIPLRIDAAYAASVAIEGPAGTLVHIPCDDALRLPRMV